VVILMIAFIEGGLRILIGRVTRDYLISHRLTPTQSAPNMFRILGSVDVLNEKMGVNLTHHDVNWIYNYHKLTGQEYYLKTRVLAVRLISCLLESNKSMNKDFFNRLRGVARQASLSNQRRDTRWGTLSLDS